MFERPKAWLRKKFTTSPSLVRKGWRQSQTFLNLEQREEQLVKKAEDELRDIPRLTEQHAAELEEMLKREQLDIKRVRETQDQMQRRLQVLVKTISANTLKNFDIAVATLDGYNDIISLLEEKMEQRKAAIASHPFTQREKEDYETLIKIVQEEAAELRKKLEDLKQLIIADLQAGATDFIHLEARLASADLTLSGDEALSNILRSDAQKANVLGRDALLFRSHLNKSIGSVKQALKKAESYEDGISHLEVVGGEVKVHIIGTILDGLSSFNEAFSEMYEALVEITKVQYRELNAELRQMVALYNRITKLAERLNDLRARAPTPALARQAETTHRDLGDAVHALRSSVQKAGQSVAGAVANVRADRSIEEKFTIYTARSRRAMGILALLLASLNAFPAPRIKEAGRAQYNQTQTTTTTRTTGSSQSTSTHTIPQQGTVSRADLKIPGAAHVTERHVTEGLSDADRLPVNVAAKDFAEYIQRVARFAWNDTNLQDPALYQEIQHRFEELMAKVPGHHAKIKLEIIGRASPDFKPYPTYDEAKARNTKLGENRAFALSQFLRATIPGVKADVIDASTVELPNDSNGRQVSFDEVRRVAAWCDIAGNQPRNEREAGIYQYLQGARAAEVRIIVEDEQTDQTIVDWTLHDILPLAVIPVGPAVLPTQPDVRMVIEGSQTAASTSGPVRMVDFKGQHYSLKGEQSSFLNAELKMFDARRKRLHDTASREGRAITIQEWDEEITKAAKQFRLDLWKAVPDWQRKYASGFPDWIAKQKTDFRQEDILTAFKSVFYAYKEGFDTRGNEASQVNGRDIAQKWFGFLLQSPNPAGLVYRREEFA